MMKKITAIIPTLNEEIHIDEAIKSVGFADEIIAVSYTHLTLPTNREV